MEDTLHTLKQRILAATLPDVPFDGWNMVAVERSAAKAGISKTDVSAAFGTDIMAVLDFFVNEADRTMLETLEKDYNLSTMRVREKIATAVMVRLRQQAPHREAVRRAVAQYALPWHAPAGLKSLYRTVDAMWKAAGDTSTDYNFYTKRLLLAKVYTSTLYVWMNDTSDDFGETESFLHRRIDDVMKIQKAKAKLKEWCTNH